MSLLETLVRGAAGKVLSAPGAVFDLLPIHRPVVDGQRLSGRMQMFSAIGKRDLLALTPPTAARRRRLDWFMSLATAVPTGPVETSEIAVPGALRARIYTPHSADGALLVFIHGGGWHVGSIDGYDGLARFLADRSGVTVLTADYRLAPEHPFPAAYDDVAAVFRYVVDNAETLGVDPARIGIGGDSAGGNLAAAVALHLPARYRPAHLSLLYPVLDGDLDRHVSSDLFTTPLDKGCVERAITWYAGTEQHRVDPRFSVLSADDVSALPPTYVATAGMDVLRDQGTALAERLRAAGVAVRLRQFDNLPHGFASTLVDPQARSAATEFAEVVRAGLGPSEA
ncbi:alpha/beta hydrolase [Nocardia sp. NPDC055029]